MGYKLEISPYLYNHHYDSNNPKILAPKIEDIQPIRRRRCRQANAEMGQRPYIREKIHSALNL